MFKINNINIFNRLKKVSLFMSIFGLLCLLVGSSYALLDDSFESTSKQIIDVGEVKLELTESKDGITFDELLDLTDKEGVEQSTSYPFTVSNIGDTPAEYDLLLISDDTLSNTLESKYIKIALETEEETYILNLAEVNNIIHSTVIDVNKSIDYTLKVWLDPRYIKSDPPTSEKTVSLVLKLDVVQYFGDTSD